MGPSARGVVNGAESPGRLVTSASKRSCTSLYLAQRPGPFYHGPRATELARLTSSGAFPDLLLYYNTDSGRQAFADDSMLWLAHRSLLGFERPNRATPITFSTSSPSESPHPWDRAIWSCSLVAAFISGNASDTRTRTRTGLALNLSGPGHAARVRRTTTRIRHAGHTR